MGWQQSFDKVHDLLIIRVGWRDHQCDMDTRYNGESKQRWEFDGQEDRDNIER